MEVLVSEHVVPCLRTSAIAVPRPAAAPHISPTSYSGSTPRSLNSAAPAAIAATCSAKPSSAAAARLDAALPPLRPAPTLQYMGSARRSAAGLWSWACCRLCSCTEGIRWCFELLQLELCEQSCTYGGSGLPQNPILPLQPRQSATMAYQAACATQGAAPSPHATLPQPRASHAKSRCHGAPHTSQPLRLERQSCVHRRLAGLHIGEGVHLPSRCRSCPAAPPRTGSPKTRGEATAQARKDGTWSSRNPVQLVHSEQSNRRREASGFHH